MYFKAYEVDDSDEDDMDEVKETGGVPVYEEEDEIVESDVELEGETVEPDHDPPQKVIIFQCTLCLKLMSVLCICDGVEIVLFVVVDGRFVC